MIPCIDGAMIHGCFDEYGGYSSCLQFHLSSPVLEILFSLILALSACYIASLVRNSTGMKSNTCLLIWHIFNLFLLITTTVIHAIFYSKAYFAEDGSEDWYEYVYYINIANVASLNTGFYVDLFLLWLLYRFMKPQNILEDGRTEASALLFAHDGKRAQEILSRNYTGDQEKRTGDTTDTNSRKFINSFIGDLIAGISTETSVTLEFMDR